MENPLNYIEGVENGKRGTPAFYMINTVASVFLAVILFAIDQDVIGCLLLLAALAFLFFFFWALAGKKIRRSDEPISDTDLASTLERSGSFEKKKD